MVFCLHWGVDDGDEEWQAAELQEDGDMRGRLIIFFLDRAKRTQFGKQKIKMAVVQARNKVIGSEDDDGQEKILKWGV